ncbi:TetR family transcriptional regulator C-terminal domain-containing protein [Streptomyces sp. NPDC057307]|uniref:TetR/AcrR family transcriptional regulator n=1 Tax=Streptomyces sp. NPDC057307 TaxID=3346096 RepID=UPI003644B146
MARQSMREELVRAALAEFHARGYNAAGVKDITDAAGTPKGSFYNHFASKEALGVVALERYGAERRLQDLADESVAPLPRLRAHFEFLRDEIVAYGYTHGCLLGNFGLEIADHSETIRAAVREGLDQWHAKITDVLAEAARDGAVAADLDTAKTARFVLNAWEGAIVGARSDRTSESFDAFFDIVFGTLLARPRP